MDYKSMIIEIVRSVKSKQILEWIYEFTVEWAKRDK